MRKRRPHPPRKPSPSPALHVRLRLSAQTLAWIHADAERRNETINAWLASELEAMHDDEVHATPAHTPREPGPQAAC